MRFILNNPSMKTIMTCVNVPTQMSSFMKRFMYDLISFLETFYSTQFYVEPFRNILSRSNDHDRHRNPEQHTNFTLLGFSVKERSFLFSTFNKHFLMSYHFINYILNCISLIQWNFSVWATCQSLENWPIRGVDLE